MGRDLCKPSARNSQSLAVFDDLSSRHTEFVASFLEDSDDIGMTEL